MKTTCALLLACGLSTFTNAWGQDAQELDRRRAELRRKYAAATSAEEKEAIIAEMNAMRRRGLASDEASAFHVKQKYRMTVERSATRYLQTANASPCIIVCLWDPRTKRASMVHFDRSTYSREALQAMVDSMGGASGLRGWVIGGWEEDRGIRADFEAIVETLVAGGATVDRQLGRRGPPQTSFSVQLDLETGTLSDYEETRYRQPHPGDENLVPLPKVR